MNIEFLLKQLSKSKFRSRFHLSLKDKQYINDKGLDEIKQHATDFISKRLKYELLRH